MILITILLTKVWFCECNEIRIYEKLLNLIVQEEAQQNFVRCDEMILGSYHLWLFAFRYSLPDSFIFRKDTVKSLG